MDYSTESPLVAAQRSAILQVRGRYERGELPFDAFREALDAITKAQSPGECASILRELPHSPLATLAALESPALVATQAPAFPAASITHAPHKRISAFMSQTRKRGVGWALAPNTHVRAFMGQVDLDLRRAQLPEQAYLKVNAIMGEVNIIIPDDVAVSVRSSTTLGEVRALGESVEGVIASGEEEYTPPGTPRARLTLDVNSLMGSAHVTLSSALRASISDLARDTLTAALEAARRGWERGGQPASLPGAGATQARLPGAPAE